MHGNRPTAVMYWSIPRISSRITCGDTIRSITQRRLGEAIECSETNREKEQYSGHCDWLSKFIPHFACNLKFVGSAGP